MRNTRFGPESFPKKFPSSERDKGDRKAWLLKCKLPGEHEQSVDAATAIQGRVFRMVQRRMVVSEGCNIMPYA